MSLRVVSGDFSLTPALQKDGPSANKQTVNISFAQYSGVYKKLTGKAVPLFDEASASPSDKAILTLLRNVATGSIEELKAAVDEVQKQFKSDPAMCRKVLTEAKELGSEKFANYFDGVLAKIGPVEITPRQSTPWLKMLGVGILIAAVAIPVILSGTQTPKYNGPVYGPDMKLESEIKPIRSQEKAYEYSNTNEYDYNCPNAARVTARRMAALEKEYQSWKDNNPLPQLVAEIPEAATRKNQPIEIAISFGKGGARQRTEFLSKEQRNREKRCTITLQEAMQE